MSVALVSLAAEIRCEVDAAETDFQSAVSHAVRAGELLIEAKAQVQHGEWLPWLEANFPGTPQTASGYMRMARHRAEIENASSIRGALTELAEPKQLGLPTRAQAHGFTAMAAGWLTDAVDAALAGGPLPPEPPLPEDPGDHLEMARYWITVAERAKVAVRRAGRRALAMAAHADGAAAAAYARVGAVGLKLAEAEPWSEDYEDLFDEWHAALDGLEVLPETQDDVVAVVLAELVRVARASEEAAA